MTKAVSGAPVSVDITTNVLINNVLKQVLDIVWVIL